MKSKRKVIQNKLQDAVEPIIGKERNKKTDEIVLKSTKKLSDLIADFMVKVEKKRKKLDLK